MKTKKKKAVRENKNPISKTRVMRSISLEFQTDADLIEVMSLKIQKEGKFISVNSIVNEILSKELPKIIKTLKK